MPAAKLRASTILRALHEAEAELVGKAVVLSDGKAGTVEVVSLDEDHGLRISIGGHVGSWPISTIKFAQGSPAKWRGETISTRSSLPRHRRHTVKPL
jgi:hypothetical protein